MTIVLILLFSALALEVLSYRLLRITMARKVLAGAAAIVGGFAAGALFATTPNLFSGLIMLLSIYRIINMMRIVEARMHERYLRRAVIRSGLALVGMQLIVSAGWLAWQHWHAEGGVTWFVVTVMQLLVAATLFVSVIRNLRRTRWPRIAKRYSDKELPTLTVAIPARNETEDLEGCLQNIIASDYPKLEIIVLDDCSQSKRTPEIIKQFAHDGVRFVQGEVPEDTWLPKNQAYDHLSREANGDYILFCGVDVRFAPDSLRKLITMMLARKKHMLSLLPQREAKASSSVSLIQAMRYYWELVPPRRFFNRPPVISSCWIIQHEALEAAGGFRSVARSIVPEAHFASEQLAADSYSFMRSDSTLGVRSTKKVAEQRDTAIRMRYPQVHRRPEQVALVTVWEACFLVLPFVLMLSDGWLHIGLLAQKLATLGSLLLIMTYSLAALSTRVNNLWFSIFVEPFAVLVDLVLLHYSMWKYEFSSVDWKGRNVCIPVMHVVPHLPYANTSGDTPATSARGQR